MPKRELRRQNIGSGRIGRILFISDGADDRFVQELVEGGQRFEAGEDLLVEGGALGGLGRQFDVVVEVLVAEVVGGGGLGIEALGHSGQFLALQGSERLDESAFGAECGELLPLLDERLRTAANCSGPGMYMPPPIPTARWEISK